jgi:CBS domain-containing protein
MRCEEIMKRNIQCLSPGDTVKTAAAKMRDLNIGFLPICDGKKVVGAITDRDIVVRVCADDKPHNVKVGEIMTREVVSARPNDDLSRVEEIMAREKKSRIMVTDEEDELVGVISLSDIVERETDHRRAARTMRGVAGRETRRA